MVGWVREDLTLAECIGADPDVVRRGASMWAHKRRKGAQRVADRDPPKIHDLTRLAPMLDQSVQAQRVRRYCKRRFERRTRSG